MYTRRYLTAVTAVTGASLFYLISSNRRRLQLDMIKSNDIDQASTMTATQILRPNVFNLNS